MSKKALFPLIFLCMATVFLMSCEEKDFVFPTAAGFTVEAKITGEYSYDATVTETYAEFTGKYLSFPIRFENGTLSCDGIEVEADVGENSLFMLPEMLKKLFSGDYEKVSVAEKDDRYIFTADILGKKITVHTDKKTELPTAFFFDEYTLTVTKIELYRDTINESHTQNMGDGRSYRR